MKNQLSPQSVKEDVKAMKARLTELGVTIRRSHLFEALAAAYGYKTWHVMSAELKSQRVPEEKADEESLQVPQVRHPFSIFVETYNTDEYAAEQLAWVQMEVNQEFVNSLFELRNLALKTGTSLNKCDEFPTAMGPSSVESSMRFSSLMVSHNDDFWYEISGKYDKGHNEFSLLPIQLLSTLIERVNKKVENTEGVSFEDCSAIYEIESSFFTKERPYLLVYCRDCSNLIDVLTEDEIL